MTVEHCPTCGQPTGQTTKVLTPAELDALSAWWRTGSVVAAADLLCLSEQTIKNHLYRARIRHGLHKTIDLVQLHFGHLRSRQELLGSHNRDNGKAA